MAAIAVLSGSVMDARASHSDAILQYFGTSWNDIALKMPEIAEAGYTALWLPPPFKGTSIWDVGFGTFDRFDLGDKDQSGTVRTKYGTAAELMNMMEVAHRFGIRVYFDNVMAHNGGPIPGYDANTSIYVQPGFVPEDFHMIVRPDGTYRKNFEGWPNFDDEWQVLNTNPFGVDIAHENPNTSFGPNLGDQFPKYVGIRHPNNPEYYPDLDLPIVVSTPGGNVTVYPFANKEPFEDIGYVNSQGQFVASAVGNGRFDFEDLNGNGQHDPGEPSEPFEDTGVDPLTPGRQTAQWGYGDGKYNMGNPIPEDVNAMLIRALRWFTDLYRPDGYRLDAVKHVPAYFFGQQSGANKDYSNAGYCGAANMQYNITRGFNDWDNHRDTTFSDNPRNDLFLYGEHIGAPPAEGPYVDAGMRLANDDFMNTLANGKLPWDLSGLDQPGYGMWGGVSVGMKYPSSHDKNFIWDGHRELATLFTFLTAGPGIVYTDGYNQSGPPDWFPRPAHMPFLGQFGRQYPRNLLSIRRNFARGDQIPKWSDQNFVAFERRDKSSNWGMSDADGTILAVLVARYGVGGQTRDFTTTFPVGARLRNYSYHGGPFYVNVNAQGKLRDDGGNPIFVDGGKYFAFSWDNPGMPAVWGTGINATVKPITILQDGEPAGTMTYFRRDGKDGDPNFNPLGVSGAVNGSYQYPMTIPRITDGTNLSFIARADGSAESIMIKLGGGMDLNSQMGIGAGGPDARDNKPGVAREIYEGFEQMRFVQRTAEKFAARNVSRNIIGSPGCETYVATIGTAGFTVNNGSGANTGSGTVTWAYHDPVANNQLGSPTLQFNPPPESAGSQPIDVYVKIGYENQPQKAFLYYTTDGATWPEGVAGMGNATTQVAEMTFDHNGAPDGSGTPVWWKATLPPLPAGTVLRYKIGVFSENAPSVFPSNGTNIAIKRNMETVFEIADFDATQAKVRRHNDYGPEYTGLAEGFHILTSRPFLKRDARAPIYNTFIQTFYYDTKTPEGEIKFPANDGATLGGNSYGVVVRTDHTTSEVWYRITDSDASNDDNVTGADNGNGAWVKATQLVPTVGLASDFPREWRFNYINIPASGSATIEVRLKELSSSDDNSLSDEAGHFTTLTRTVNTQGDSSRMFVRWPQADGDVIGGGYVAKVQFSKGLANGLSEQDLINRFSVSVNDVEYPTSDYWIVWNATNDYHELAFEIPNLYNGDPDFQHQIAVTHSRPLPLSTLQAERNVKAQPGALGARVDFLSPQPYQGTGSVNPIILPQKVDLLPSDREFLIQVETDAVVQNLSIVFTQGSGTVTPQGDPILDGDTKLWTFLWSNMTEGSFQLRANADTDGNPDTTEASATRDTVVIFRQIVDHNPDDPDMDDDGLPNSIETTAVPYPSSNSDSWTNGDVHVAQISGRTNPQSPDSDGDGLPDGLELGWRTPGPHTNTDTDTDGDGYPNFIADLDPPFYNTLDNYGKVPNVDPAGISWRRAELRGGSVTDPNNPDTDGDGLPDGIEDANRNGWVDGDGDPLMPWEEPSLARNWPNGKIDPGEIWLETDPNNPDSDGDGLVDGYGEDKNLNGRTDMFLLYEDQTSKELLLGEDTDGPDHIAGAAFRIGGPTSRAINYAALFAAYAPHPDGGGTHQTNGWPKLIIAETDPLNPDTDGNGLPDGWEVNHGLDPLDNGVYNFRTGGPGNPDNGADGDLTGDGVTNLQHFLNGTDPRVPVGGSGTPVGGITIGPLPPDQQTTIGNVTNAGEFTDWAYDDLIALDAYDGNGGNYQSGDVYRLWDGHDTSRDIVAFYARDGGATADDGDDKFYFRVDLHDLQPNAEQGYLSIYILINVGNAGPSGSGEMVVPDGIGCLTMMKWNVAVAAYGSGSEPGRVFVDLNPAVNTTNLGNSLDDPQFGIETRGVAANGFGAIYYNSDLDAVEFGISRQALLDAGWAGDPATLRYQVFTTKPFLNIVGPKITDSLRDSGIANDFRGDNNAGTRRQALANDAVASRLNSWVGIQADNDRGRRAKLILLVHGNQAVRPGSFIQSYLDAGSGGGYDRPIDAHQAFDVPLTMHLTPTIAGAIQWAKVDPAANKPRKDGPALNARLKNLMEQGRINLLGTTFSDHILPYFSSQYNADNVDLASEVLSKIYTQPSSSVFWTPERVADHTILGQVGALGYSYTFIDQSRHLWKWFGRDTALGNDGYRINQINGIRCFVINDMLNAYRYQNTGNGLSIQLRQLLHQRARSWQQDQLVVLFHDWNDFTSASQATAYDRNIRWIANKPWIEVITPDQIANNEIDLSVPPDGNGNAWSTVNRGNPTLARVSHDYIDWASQENYDNWYIGQANREEGLLNKVFNIRPNVPMPQAFGRQGESGLIHDSWNSVASMIGAQTPLGKLARSVIHTSTFVTAFHNQSNVDLRKFSTGAYLYPDTSFNTLADFARISQAQARFASVYKEVEEWAVAAQGGAYYTNPQAVAKDIDLDGEDEYLLYNDRVFAVFEALGGRLIAAWVRHLDNGTVYQSVGNFLSFANTETEQEGTGNVTGNSPDAHRTSGFKDWFAQSGSDGASYVNNLYTVAPAGGGTIGWKFTSSDGKVVKTVTLAALSSQLKTHYSLSSIDTLYVRFGLTPNLYDLFVHGQENLGDVFSNGALVHVLNTADPDTVRAYVRYNGPGFTGSLQANAIDDGAPSVNFDTINMRNQAQTQQVEVFGGNGLTVSLGLETGPTLTIDSDGDGLPDWWEEQHGLDPDDPDGDSGAGGNPSGDGISNLEKFVFGLDPNERTQRPVPAVAPDAEGVQVTFDTIKNREYRVLYTEDPAGTWQAASSYFIGTGNPITWTDTGDTTGDHPDSVAKRFYRVEVRLPEP